MLNHSRNQLELFDLVEGKSIVILEPSDISHRDASCFSADGSSIVVFDKKTGIEIWDLRELRSKLSALGLDWPSWMAAKPPRTLEVAIQNN